MTVDRLTREMSNHEYVQWCVFYGRRAQEADLAAKRAGHAH